MHRAAFLAHQDVAQRVLLEERVVDRQDGAAGIAENDIDALVDEGLDDDLRSTDRLGRHDDTPQRNNRLRVCKPPEAALVSGGGRTLVS